mmetsp:Transcript_25889/g.83641  ORF Transcript_25889/g.83641 Transcript_25889/m.83641 type:complete len:225 (+) Transcript_25889:515-1189(+)
MVRRSRLREESGFELKRGPGAIDFRKKSIPLGPAYGGAARAACTPLDGGSRSVSVRNTLRRASVCGSRACIQRGPARSSRDWSRTSPFASCTIVASLLLAPAKPSMMLHVSPPSCETIRWDRSPSSPAPVPPAWLHGTAIVPFASTTPAPGPVAYQVQLGRLTIEVSSRAEASQTALPDSSTDAEKSQTRRAAAEEQDLARIVDSLAARPLEHASTSSLRLAGK